MFASNGSTLTVVLAVALLAGCAPARPLATGGPGRSSQAGDAAETERAVATSESAQVAKDAEAEPPSATTGAAPVAADADAGPAAATTGSASVAADESPAATDAVNRTEGAASSTAPAQSPEAVPEATLPDLGPAPELAGDPWLNTAEPLDLARLRGKVVLVEFWTFGCINCRNVLPHVAGWHARYAGDRFEVVGVHYPEFDYERELDNVRGAVAELGVGYPVAVDNDGATWGAWHQRYWPTLHLVDHRGRLRYTHIGEGGYAETEAAIRALIADAEHDV